MEKELDLSQSPGCYRNFTEDELFLEAKRNHYNSECYRPSFLIRMHNLIFKRVASREVKSKINFHPQDLTLNIRRGETYTVGQPDSHDEIRQKGQRIDKKNKSVVNLLGDFSSPFVSEKHFEVGRDGKGDKIRIRDLNSKQGTFVNGTKLSPQINRKLKDGDIVSLGISNLDPTCKLDKGFFWVFKFKKVPEEDETYLKTLYSQVLGNTVILSNILTTIYDPYRHLPGKRERVELTNIRTVSKFWNEISIPILRKKLELYFKVNQKWVKLSDGGKKIHLDEKESIGIWKEQFNANIALFSSLELRRVSFREAFTMFATTDIKRAEVKLFENFFRLHGNQISKIVISFHIEHGAKYHKSREQVLQSLFKECKSTAKFTIREECSGALAKVEPSKSTTKLTIYADIINYENLLKTFPNIVKLSLGPNCLQRFLNFIYNTNGEFAEEALKHLKVVKVGPFISVEEYDFLDLFDFANLKFPIKIEELFLKNMPLEKDPSRSRLLSDIISGFGDSLIKFKLTYAASKDMSCARIQLPKMEKLETLEISVNNQNVLKWNFEFGGFPNLKVIHFKTDRKEDIESPKNKFLESLLCAENIQYFPKLEKAIVSYGQLQSKNFAFL